MAIHKQLEREDVLIDALKAVFSMDADDAAKVIRKLIIENERLLQENKEFKSELSRLKEDKAENEATYEKMITYYRKRIKKMKGETNEQN